MATIIESGLARNLLSRLENSTLIPDSVEKQFVTFTNDLGAVHTIIVDVEHIAKDAESLVKWFEHTKTTVTHRSGPEHTAKFIPPDKVLAMADEHLQETGGAKPADNASAGAPSGGGFQ